MFDKLFGPPPADLDDKRWKLHWLASFAAVGAVLTIIALAYVAWTIATKQGPGVLH